MGTKATQDLLRAGSYKHPDFAARMLRDEREAMLRTLVGVYNTRESLMKTLESLKRSDAAQTIIDVIIDDGFYSSVNSQLFTVNYVETGREKEVRDRDTIDFKMNAEIETFLTDRKVRTLVKDLMEDLLYYGSYPLRIVGEKGKGIVDIIDNVDVLNTVGIYKADVPQFFLERKVQENTLYIHKPDVMMEFLLAPRKVRVKLDGFALSTRLDTILPEHVRLGRSIIYPAIEKLRQLRILELSLMADDLKKILAPLLVTVGVPDQMDADDVADLTEKYEERLTGTIPVDQSMVDLEFSDLLALVARVRVLPNFGSSKGGVASIDIPTALVALENRAEKLRVGIANAVGVPPYYLTTEAGGTTDGSNRLQMLKVFSRYTRKLISVQESIGAGLKQLVMMHMRFKGTPLKEDYLKVAFSKNIVNGDQLDFMEFTSAAVETVRGIHGALSEICDGNVVKAKVDQRKFVDFINSMVQVGGNVGGLLELAPEKESGIQGGGNSLDLSGGAPAGGNITGEMPPTGGPSEAPVGDELAEPGSSPEEVAAQITPVPEPA